MAKRFNELYKPTTEIKSDGRETAKARLSPQAKGEKLKKDKFIKIRVTEEERERWNEYAKTQNRTLTNIIRQLLNDHINGNS